MFFYPMLIVGIGRNSGFGVKLVFYKTGIRVKALLLHNGHEELKLHSIISVINEQWVYDK